MEQDFAEKHNDKAPRTPSRTLLDGPGVEKMANPDTEADTVAITGVGPKRAIRRTRSNNEIEPLEREDLKRRASIDYTPRTPQRLGTDVLEDPTKVVEAMFANLPGQKDKFMDGAPSAPRRSWDRPEVSDMVDQMVEEQPTYSRQRRKSADGAPLAPRRSRDSVEFGAIVDELYLESSGPAEGRKSPDSIPRPPPRNSKESSTGEQDGDFLATVGDAPSGSIGQLHTAAEEDEVDRECESS